MANKKRKKTKKKDVGIDLQVVILIVISILLGLIIYVQSGYLGETLSPVIGGLFGWIKYFIPIGAFSVAVSIACEEDKQSIIRKMLQYGVMLICISAIITVITSHIDYTKDIEEIVTEAYQLGNNNIPT